MPARIPAPFQSILSPPPPSPHPRLGEGGGGERMLLGLSHTRYPGPYNGGPSDSRRRACVSVRAPGPNDRLSVGNRPRFHPPCTVYASSVRHAINKSPPIERTVPSQVHPAAQRRLSLTSLGSRQRRCPRCLQPQPLASSSSTHGHA